LAQRNAQECAFYRFWFRFVFMYDYDEDVASPTGIRPPQQQLFTSTSFLRRLVMDLKTILQIVNMYYEYKIAGVRRLG